MKAVPKVNIDGLYLEDTIVDDAFNGVVPFYSVEQPNEIPEPEIAGYIVGIPVTPGLYRPRFDLVGWQKHEDAPIAATPLSQPEFWFEGLTPEEIEEITRPLPQEPTELELLTEEVSQIKSQTEQQQTELELTKADSTELRQLSSTLGSEQVKQELTSIDLKQQNSVIGGELVKKDISILDLYMQNQVLGQMLASLELKIMAGSGEQNV